MRSRMNIIDRMVIEDLGIWWMCLVSYVRVYIVYRREVMLYLVWMLFKFWRVWVIYSLSLSGI